MSVDTSYLELYAHRKQSTVMKVLFICHKFQLQFLHNIADKTPLMQLYFSSNFFVELIFSTFSTKNFKYYWWIFLVCCSSILSQNSLPSWCARMKTIHWSGSFQLLHVDRFVLWFQNSSRTVKKAWMTILLETYNKIQLWLRSKRGGLLLQLHTIYYCCCVADLK